MVATVLTELQSHTIVGSDCNVIVRSDPRSWLAVPSAAEFADQQWQEAVIDAAPETPPDAVALAETLRRTFGDDAVLLLHRRGGRLTGLILQLQLHAGHSARGILAAVTSELRTTVRPSCDRVHAAALGAGGIRLRSFVGDPFDGDAPGIYQWHTVFPVTGDTGVVCSVVGRDAEEFLTLAEQLQPIYDSFESVGRR